MRLLLVTNRDSGSATAVDPARVLAAHGCDVVDASIGDAVTWSRSGIPDHVGGIERVAVAGGDGSIGCAAVIATRLGVPLAVIPAGTANDFARALELPVDLDEACELAATGTRLRDVDLARVDGRPFLNVASVGIAPHAAQHASRLKRTLRALAYPAGAALAAFRTRPIHVVAHVDGELAWSGAAWQAMVASSGAFGGWASTGMVRHGDGKLDLVVVPAGRGTRQLVVDAAALMRGELAKREGVHHGRGATIELVLHRPPRVVVDGELVRAKGYSLVATVESKPTRIVTG